MKKSILALCALTLAAGLSACGGGTSSYTIDGTVFGLQYPGLVLQNNATNDLPVKPDLDASNNPKTVTYRFPGEVDYGKAYDVTVKTQPEHQFCAPNGGTADTAGRLTTINAVISCALTSHKIGGTITNLTGAGLALINGTGGGTVTPAAGATDFTFGAEVTFGLTYGVTILTQPSGQTCSVTNGAGTMGDENVTSIKVNCVNNPT